MKENLKTKIVFALLLYYLQSCNAERKSINGKTRVGKILQLEKK